MYFCYFITVFEALQYPLYLHSIKTHKGKVYSVMKYFNVFLQQKYMGCTTKMPFIYALANILLK